jgi:hypothetical protein
MLVRDWIRSTHRTSVSTGPHLTPSGIHDLEFWWSSSSDEWFEAESDCSCEDQPVAHLESSILAHQNPFVVIIQFDKAGLLVLVLSITTSGVEVLISQVYDWHLRSICPNKGTILR